MYKFGAIYILFFLVACGNTNSKPLICSNECSQEGILSCENNTIIECKKDIDGCLKNSVISYCSQNEICMNGLCFNATCDNQIECFENQKECIDSSSFRVCGNIDSDICFEWSEKTYCYNNSVCKNGECICLIDTHFENDSCVSNSKTESCVDNSPENSTAIIDEVDVTWNSDSNSWSETPNCSWSCNTGFEEINNSCVCPVNTHIENGSCVSNSKMEFCVDNHPENSTVVIDEVNVTWNSDSNSWSETPNCSWSCNTGFEEINNSCVCPVDTHIENGSCVSNSKMEFCIDNSPENSTATISQVIIYWNSELNSWESTPYCEWSCNYGYNRLANLCLKCKVESDNSNYYVVCSNKKTYQQAREYCQNICGDLATVESETKNSLLKSYIDYNDFYIGGDDIDNEGSWFWIDGTKFWEGDGDGNSINGEYTAWGSNQPDNWTNDNSNGEDCLTIRKNSGWNDVSCSYDMPYICEISKEKIVNNIIVCDE